MNAEMFGVVDRLLVRGPEHVRDADRIRRMQIAVQPPGRDLQRNGWFGCVTYDALRREGQSFEAVAAYTAGEDNAILGRGLDARRINRGEATASLFGLLGVAPALGRFYTEREDDTAAPEPVAVIGFGLWQRDFAGRTDVIGESSVLDNVPYTIVGVAPKGFYRSRAHARRRVAAGEPAGTSRRVAKLDRKLERHLALHRRAPETGRVVRAG